MSAFLYRVCDLRVCVYEHKHLMMHMTIERIFSPSMAQDPNCDLQLRLGFLKEYTGETETKTRPVQVGLYCVAKAVSHLFRDSSLNCNIDLPPKSAWGGCLVFLKRKSNIFVVIFT